METQNTNSPIQFRTPESVPPRSQKLLVTLLVFLVVAVAATAYVIFFGHTKTSAADATSTANSNSTNVNTAAVSNQNTNTNNTVNGNTNLNTPSDVNENSNSPTTADVLNDNGDTNTNTYGLTGVGPDSDGDKISDSDETNYFKTNPQSKDTDGDGFDDLIEIQERYNPLGPGRATPEQRGQWAMDDPNATPLIISDPIIEKSDRSATVSWTTNIPASSELNYGLTASYGDVQRDLTYVTAHSFVIAAQKNQTYHLKISGCAMVPFAYCRGDIDQTLTAE